MKVDSGSGGFERHELGFFLPCAVDAQESTSTDLPNVATYLTYSEIAERDPLGDDEIIGRLQEMAATDCLRALAMLGTKLFAGRDQRELIDHVVGKGPLGRTLHGKLADSRWSKIFSEQQLVHLARLTILHADRRDPDDFKEKALYDEWVTCLFAVTDHLDAGLNVGKHDERLAWEIRQCELNHHTEQLPDIAIHYELYSIHWPEILPEQAAAVEQAFLRMTGLSMSDFFMVGSAVMARLYSYGHTDQGLPMIEPSRYFSTTKVEEGVPQAFFDFVARDIDGLQSELRTEESRYGPTTYGSLTFERFPLIETEPGTFLPTSTASLHRRITQGVFHVLSEAAESEGRDRRYYTSRFGEVFQSVVENTVRRAEAFQSDPAMITADEEYGGRRRRRRSSDVILAYDRHLLFLEVVSGPLQAATTTRGDVRTFRDDLQRLVIEKCKQLDRCINDFLEGEFRVSGAERETIALIIPAIVMSHSFPHAETIIAEVETAVRDRGFLRQPKADKLAIICAEDLFFCEGHMERGRTLMSLIRSWKSGPNSSLPFKNELISLGGGRAPGSSHFEKRFAEANAKWATTLLGKQFTTDQILDARAEPAAPSSKLWTP